MKVLSTKAAVRTYVAEQKAAGLTVALVPTMGALHLGHLALIRAAHTHAEVVITSIFVNPTQFAPTEDLDAYPRDTEGDLNKAEQAGSDAAFLPSDAEMYAEGASTVVQVADLAAPLCGASRPAHFAGVCTVVLKLFNVVGCDVAVFGEKDYQQLAVIRRMVRDLDVPVRVVGHPIVREPDGLAMSSRNANLDAQQRAAAVCLNRGLAAAQGAWHAGERDPRVLEAVARAPVDEAVGAEVDYIQARDPHDLSALDGPVSTVLLAMAVRFGDTRLIDNRLLGAGRVLTGAPAQRR